MHWPGWARPAANERSLSESVVPASTERYCMYGARVELPGHLFLVCAFIWMISLELLGVFGAYDVQFEGFGGDYVFWAGSAQSEGRRHMHPGIKSPPVWRPVARRARLLASQIDKFSSRVHTTRGTGRSQMWTHKQETHAGERASALAL